MRFVVPAVVIAAAIGGALVWQLGRPAPVPLDTSGAQADAVSGSLGKFIVTEPPVSAPVTPFTGPDGAELTLRAFEGKVVLVNFWATWCQPCVREMPELDRLQQQLGGAEFAVVALSEDRQGAAVVDPFFAEHGIVHLARYVDPKSAVSRALQLRGYPTTLLLDRQGRELGRMEGGTDWAGAEAREVIRKALAGG